MKSIRVQALFFTLALTVAFSLNLLSYPAAVNAQTVHATPSFDYSPLTPRVGDVVTFDALWWEQYWMENYDPRTFSYSWNFGDGTYATGVTVNHTYTSPGTYAVGVTVDDNLGLGGSSEMEIEIRQQTPVTVHISLSSDRVYTGQEITISGSLTYNGIGVPDAWILLSSQTYIEGASWNEIASVKTDGDGKYSAIWKPLYGAYKIKATWAGNSTYPETSISINLNVKRFGDLITDFTSNSTITELNYNSTTRVLSFSAEGPSGTAGFVKIALEKDPAFNPNDIIVLLDERPIEYTIDSTDQSWTVGITYTHSIHNVTIYFNEGRVPEVPLLIFAAILVVLITFLVILSTRTEKTKP